MSRLLQWLKQAFKKDKQTVAEYIYSDIVKASAKEIIKSLQSELKEVAPIVPFKKRY